MVDTDVLVWASRGHPGAARTIDAATDRSLSIVSLMELLQGARSKVEIRQIRESLRQLRFRVRPLSEVIGGIAAAFVEQHSLAHGMAIESGHPLCTANAEHFRPIRTLSRVAFRP